MITHKGSLERNQFYYYKGNKYLIEYFCKMKLENSEWAEAVIYSVANEDRFYVRSVEDFESKFNRNP